jgi:hypothetical protein
MMVGNIYFHIYGQECYDLLVKRGISKGEKILRDKTGLVIYK